MKLERLKAHLDNYDGTDWGSFEIKDIKKLIAVAEAAKLVIPYCESFNHHNEIHQHDNAKNERCPIEKIFQNALRELDQE